MLTKRIAPSGNEIGQILERFCLGMRREQLCYFLSFFLLLSFSLEVLSTFFSLSGRRKGFHLTLKQSKKFQNIVRIVGLPKFASDFARNVIRFSGISLATLIRFSKLLMTAFSESLSFSLASI